MVEKKNKTQKIGVSCSNDKSRHPEVFIKKCVVENCVKFSFLRVSFSIKLQLPPPSLRLQLETQAHVFSCGFYEVFKNTYFGENLQKVASATRFWL